MGPLKNAIQWRDDSVRGIRIEPIAKLAIHNSQRSRVLVDLLELLELYTVLLE